MARSAGVCACILVLSLLVACGSRLTPANLDKIKSGMTTTEVKQVLGEPTEVKTSGFGGFSATTYVYKKGNSEVTIVFVNDKVQMKDGTFAK